MDLELVLRIVAGTVLGAVIGYERDLHKRPAGLRTHALVALASATFMVVSSHMAYFQHYRPGDGVEVDGSRIAASVVSGIGFLAGGAILRTGLTIQGLTTAAGLWLVAAIGLCAGAGMYVESVAATAIGIGTLTILRVFEDKNEIKRRLRIDLAKDAEHPTAIVARLAGAGITASFEGWISDRGAATQQLTLAVLLPVGDEPKLVALLETDRAIVRMQLEST
jgi:putative Mg2+ transporter-C (MgtC) family protein